MSYKGRESGIPITSEPCPIKAATKSENNQSAAGSVVITAYKIMQPLFQVIAYIVNTAKQPPCKLLYCFISILL